MEAPYRRALATIIGAFALVLVTAGPVAAASGAGDAHAGDPPGNNGTVKIDGVPFDNAPDNEPHPGCVFQVDFYGFDAGDLTAEVTFEAVAPTAGGTLLTDQVPIGQDSHAGGGSERGLDASRTYDLSELASITPQPNQGWHVRLTVDAEGSQGSGVKHKVFWVDGCGTTGNVAAGNENTSMVGAGTAGAAAPEAPAAAAPTTPQAGVMAAELIAPVAATLPISPTATTKPADVLAESITRRPAVAPSLLARTGIGLGLAVLAVALISGGVLLVRAFAPRVARS